MRLPGKSLYLLASEISAVSFCPKFLPNPSVSLKSQNCKKVILQRYNSSKRLFDTDDLDSDLSGESVIYISSDESGEVSDDWESNCLTDTVQLIEMIERKVHASPVLIGGRIKTAKGEEEEMVAGPSTSHTNKKPLPNWGQSILLKIVFCPQGERSAKNSTVQNLYSRRRFTHVSAPTRERPVNGNPDQLGQNSSFTAS